jgi:MFS family permease
MKISEKIGAKLHFGVFILCFSLSLYALTIVSNYWIGVIAACLLAVCYGMINPPTLNVCWGWYPDHKGMVTGMILASHGFIGILINVLLNIFMNPNNKAATVVRIEGNTP